jgi:hypothetical protein
VTLSSSGVTTLFPNKNPSYGILTTTGNWLHQPQPHRHRPHPPPINLFPTCWHPVHRSPV